MARSRSSRPAAPPQFISVSISTSILAPCYVIRIHDNETQNTIRPKDFILAHAFASLTTSSAFGETSVSILTPAPESLDKFLQYTDTGSYWCVLKYYGGVRVNIWGTEQLALRFELECKRQIKECIEKARKL